MKYRKERRTKPKNRERERGDSFPIVEANEEDGGYYFFFLIVLQS